jgi:hypothetical protein
MIAGDAGFPVPVAQLWIVRRHVRVKTFFTIFVTSYFGMVLLLLVLNFALPDFVGDHPSPFAGFLIHVTDVVVVILGVLSWGASSPITGLLLGFPASAAILAVSGIVFQRLLRRRRVTNL